MILLLLIASQAAGAMAPDQTGDFIIAARFLEAVRSHDKRAEAMTAGAAITDPTGTEKRTLDEFGRVTNACRLHALSVSANKVSQIGVTWFCPSPMSTMYGAIWVKGGRIERVSFGRQPTIRMGPVKP